MYVCINVTYIQKLQVNADGMCVCVVACERTSVWLCVSQNTVSWFSNGCHILYPVLRPHVLNPLRRVQTAHGQHHEHERKNSFSGFQNTLPWTQSPPNPPSFPVILQGYFLLSLVLAASECRVPSMLRNTITMKLGALTGKIPRNSGDIPWRLSLFIRSLPRVALFGYVIKSGDKHTTLYYTSFSESACCNVTLDLYLRYKRIFSSSYYWLLGWQNLKRLLS